MYNLVMFQTWFLEALLLSEAVSTMLVCIYLG